MTEKEEIIYQWKENAEKEFDNHLNFLKTHRGKSIDEEAVVLNDKAFSKINCLECANCCKTTPAVVSRSDVKRISKSLSIPPKVFIKKYLIEDIDGSLMTNGVPCTFLNNDNTCAIYEVRPEACRTYPHLDDFHFSKRSLTNAKNTLVCPAAYYVVSQLNAKHNS